MAELNNDQRQKFAIINRGYDIPMFDTRTSEKLFPGHLLEIVDDQTGASDFNKGSKVKRRIADEDGMPLLVALEDLFRGENWNKEYGKDQYIRYAQPRSGHEMNLKIADGAAAIAIVPGSQLIIDPDNAGCVKLRPDASNKAVLGVATNELKLAANGGNAAQHFITVRIS